jgi:hypothetical protein
VPAVGCRARTTGCPRPYRLFSSGNSCRYRAQISFARVTRVERRVPRAEAGRRARGFISPMRRFQPADGHPDTTSSVCSCSRNPACDSTSPRARTRPSVLRAGHAPRADMASRHMAVLLLTRIMPGNRRGPIRVRPGPDCDLSSPKLHPSGVTSWPAAARGRQRSPLAG